MLLNKLMTMFIIILCLLPLFCLTSEVTALDVRTPLWTYQTGGDIRAVAISSGGQYVVIGSDDGVVYFLNKTGDLLWKYKIKGAVYSLALSYDGQYLAVAAPLEHLIYFFNKKGDILWKRSIGGRISYISMSKDGQLIGVCGAGGGNDSSYSLYVFSNNGTLLWAYNTSSTGLWAAFTSVAFSAKGKNIVAGAFDGYLYFFNKLGTLLWRNKLDGYPIAVSISEDGKYIGAISISTLYFFDSNGNELWSYSLKGKGGFNSLSLTPDGKYLVAGAGVNKGNQRYGKIYFFDNNGTLLWTYEAGADVWSVDTSERGNYVIAGSGDHNIYFLRKDGNLIWKYRAGNYVTSVAITSKGEYVIAGTGDYKAYMFAGSSEKALIKISSIPSNATVYVDDIEIGNTPISEWIKVGHHKIKLEMQGYQTWEEFVYLNPNETWDINITLSPLNASSSTTSHTYLSTQPTTTLSSRSTATTPSTIGISEIFATVGVSNLKPFHIVGTLIGLILVGSIVAKKVRSGKGKPRILPGATEKQASPKKPEHVKSQKTVPYFPPELLDKYEPLEFLGEGGFAKVFKVKRRSDGKIIALKVSRLDEKAKKFFLKEVRAWCLLNHKNIVKLYNAFDEPLPHLEIEFVDGIKLNDEVIRDLGKYPKPVDEKKALNFIRGIAEGLKHAHSRQVFHRDLKPQNVLITSDLTPKITDWGLAKVGAISTTATTTKGLTLLYAAPEQLDDETYGHTDNRTDIYQLGLIFYELLTGKLPYQGTSPAVVMGKVINPDIKPKPPSHFNKALAKYDGIFEKLLAKRKEDRYQSVEEFLSDLNLLKKLDEERRELEKTIEKTKTTMSMTTDSKELRKLKRQVVEQLSGLALIHAQLNDKAELINALEDLKAFTKEHKGEIENAISQFELMLRESIPISRLTLDELKVLLHKVQREVEG